MVFLWPSLLWLLLILPLLLAFFIMQKQFMDSFVSAGVKE